MPSCGRRGIPSPSERQALQSEIEGSRSTLDEILRRAAQVLGVLTQELGVAVSPAFHDLVLERLELVPVASDRLLLVFNLRGGVVRTIFVQVSGVAMAAASVQRVAQLLNERLGGIGWARSASRWWSGCATPTSAAGHRELLNIFIAERGRHLRPVQGRERGGARERADARRPAGVRLERRDARVCWSSPSSGTCCAWRSTRAARPGSRSPSAARTSTPRLADFTLVTSSYQAGDLKGVIGVMGPTRMPYDKIIGLVEHTSRLVEGLLE